MKTKFKANAIALARYIAKIGIIHVCACLVLALYTFLLGFTFPSSVLFWFFILPGLIIFLCSKFFNSPSGIRNAMVTIVIFYSFMVFMIYRHFPSDFFTLMMISFLWNFLIMIIVRLSERDGQASKQNHAG